MKDSESVLKEDSEISKDWETYSLSFLSQGELALMLPMSGLLSVDIDCRNLMEVTACLSPSFFIDFNLDGLYIKLMVFFLVCFENLLVIINFESFLPC